MKVKTLILFIFLTTCVFSQNAKSENGKYKDIGVWKIENGIFIDRDHPYNSIAKENWKVFYNLFPKKVTQKYIKQLVLFTDGLDESTGAVQPIDSENKNWSLMLDVEDVNFNSKNKNRIKQSLYTLIHEFGHIITLNYSQVCPSFKSINDKVQSYVTTEGESYRNSYLNQFVQLYWKGSLLTKWSFIKKKYCKTEAENCLKKLRGLYNQNYYDFLTDYAAESPEEDIAESWTEFILRKKNKTKFISDRKVHFFYVFPELIRYRRVIKANLKKLHKKYKITN